MLNPPSTSVSSRPRRRPSSLAEAQDVQCGTRPDVDGRRIVFERNLLGELQVERDQDQVAVDHFLDFFKATLQIAHVSLRPPNGLAFTCGRSCSSAVRVGDRRVVRRPPQRVDEDPGRAPCRAGALNFPTGHPVVDGTGAHVEKCARPPDRDGFPVGRHRFDRHPLHWDIATTHGRPVRTGPLNTLDKTYRHRVTEAAAIAERRPSLEDASMYTRRVSDALAAAVDCYAGYIEVSRRRVASPVGTSSSRS